MIFNHLSARTRGLLCIGKRRGEPAAGHRLRILADPVCWRHWELWFDLPTVLEHGKDEWFRIWSLSILISLGLALWTSLWVSLGVSLCYPSPGTKLLEGHG